MHRYDPDLRLVASFRDPIERAFSQWSMERERKNRYPEFSEAIELYDDESMLDRVPPGAGRWTVHRRSMVIRGLYGAQLERGLAQFDRSQWQLVDFAELVRDYTAALDRLTDFLELHRYRKYPALPTNPTPQKQVGTPPSADDIRRLVDRYNCDLALFEDLSGLDVSAWTTRRIEVGELSAAELADTFARKFVAG